MVIGNPPILDNTGGVCKCHFPSTRAISSSLLRSHGSSLSNEPWHALLVEVEGIVNSHSIATDKLNDITSLASLSPVSLFTIKEKVVIHLQVILRQQIGIEENKGQQSSICPTNFGTDGERKCYYLQRIAGNGINSNESARVDMPSY